MQWVLEQSLSLNEANRDLIWASTVTMVSEETTSLILESSQAHTFKNSLQAKLYYSSSITDIWE